MFCWFPCVVAFRVAFPFEEILESFILSKSLVHLNVFYLIFCFSPDKIGQWSGEVWAM